METTTLHPVVMKLNFPFITRKPSFCGRTLIEGHNTELLHRYVLAMALELKANAADRPTARCRPSVWAAVLPPSSMAVIWTTCCGSSAAAIMWQRTPR